MSDLYERIIVMAPFPEPLHMVTYCGTLCSGCILREYFVRIWSLFLGYVVKLLVIIGSIVSWFIVIDAKFGRNDYGEEVETI
jgi:hypothetical protein